MDYERIFFERKYLKDQKDKLTWILRNISEGPKTRFLKKIFQRPKAQHMWGFKEKNGRI